MKNNNNLLKYYGLCAIVFTLFGVVFMIASCLDIEHVEKWFIISLGLFLGAIATCIVGQAEAHDED